MEDRLQELKNVLQTLALPVSGQMYLLQDDCTRVEVLAGAFNAAHQTVASEAHEALTPGQATALERLDERLTEVRRQLPRPICSELSMRQSPEWQRIRSMARETLVRFDWRLEVPTLALTGDRSN